MSNGAVGKLYERIIDAVINESRHDFEENGVDSKTIEDLRETWQRNMSNMGRAKFPWDPDSPEPLAAPVAQPTPQPPPAPSPAQQAPPIKTEAPPAPSPTNNATPQLPLPNHAPIKQEQTFDTSMFQLPAMPPTGAYNQNPHYAQQRALSNIQQKFGNQATGAINVGQMNGHSATPDFSSQPPAKRIKTEGGLGSSQTDGAGDEVSGDDPSSAWRDVMTAKNSLSSERRAAADGMMRRQAEAIQQRLEAGGLLVPLDECHSSMKAKAKARKISRAPHDPAAPSTINVPQYDGPDDDDEDEKAGDSDDAINSDLDDSDDENDESALQGDSHQGDMMLCLYDKVQRVKNKWKCQLKDGVITIGEKDYVFHKANGEFEW